MLDQTCPSRCRTNLFHLALLGPLLVFSEAAGQSAARSGTAAFRTLDVMNVAAICREADYPKIQRACEEGAPSEVIAFEKDPSLDNVPTPGTIETALASLLAARDAARDELASLMAEFDSLSAQFDSLLAAVGFDLRAFVQSGGELTRLSEAVDSITERPTSGARSQKLSEAGSPLSDFNSKLSEFSKIGQNLDVDSKRLLEITYKIQENLGVLDRGSGEKTRSPAAATGTVGLGLSFPSATFAVADFLMERVKAELVLTTLRVVRDSLSTRDLRVLLPQHLTTCSQGKEETKLSCSLANYRRRFERGLQVSPEEHLREPLDLRRLGNW